MYNRFLVKESGKGGDLTRSVAPTDSVHLRLEKVRIDVVSGPDAGRSILVPGLVVRVGSGAECHLTLSDTTVSRHHLTIRVTDGAIRLRDEGSRNGTLVDGMRVVEVFARPDSSIVLGQTTLRLALTADVVELPLSERSQFGGLLGESVAMRRMFSILEKVAATETTVLIEGETGTGKELVAEALHEESARANGPLVVFDCSAVSSQLMESELFGHVRGAFTGAVADRIGAFEAADGGTLFLDEVGELPLDLQPKLLRALERFEVRRVGTHSSRAVDVRVVAATNRSLAAEVERGNFREDLYYRLAVVHVAVPPLRERASDIPLLINHFARAFGSSDSPLPDNVVRAFSKRSWPGNVRELRNAVSRALSIGPPRVSGESDDATTTSESFAVDLSVPYMRARDQIVEAFEKAYVEKALAEAGGSVTRAAEIAGVSRKFIYRAIARYRLRDDS